MNTIEIDDQVFSELAGRAIGFHINPNDVLRRLLNLPPRSSSQPHVNQVEKPKAGSQSLLEFTKSERFQRHHQSIDRFLVILGWLHTTQPEQFAKAALEFQR